MSAHERDYIERTIATVRNHRDAENCWPQWANIFADEIEACWKEIEELRAAEPAAPTERGSSAAVVDTDATPQDGDGPETVGERQGRQPRSVGAVAVGDDQ